MKGLRYLCTSVTHPEISLGRSSRWRITYMPSADLPGVMIALVVAGVVGFVGLQVMSTVISTTGISNESDPFYDASTALESGFDDAFGLIAVAFLVIVLSVIVVYLYGLRGR